MARSVATGPAFPWPLLWFWTRRVLPAWLGIALILFGIQIAVCGIVHDNEQVKAMIQYLDILPSFLTSVIGGESLRVGKVAALVAIGYRDPAVLFLCMLFAVGVPGALLAGEVQRGTMELILSRDITRRQVYLCAAFITTAGLLGLVMVLFLGTVTAVSLFDFDQEVPLYAFFKLAVVGGVLAGAAGGVALLASASLSRRFALSIAVTYLIVSYIIDAVGAWWPPLAWLTPATLFYYLNPDPILSRPGWPLRDVCVLLAVFALTTVAGAICWQRRDLPL